MSQENVEIVRRWIELWNEGDWDAVFQNAAPGIEIDMSRAIGPISGVLVRDEFRRSLEEFAELWESVRLEPHEFIEAGDLVIVPLTLRGRGRDGIEVVSRATWVWTIRDDGASERLSMYQELHEALEALGLSEQDAHAES